jgi:hypothetical protein
MDNAIHPDRISPAERLAEIAEILDRREPAAGGGADILARPISQWLIGASRMKMKLSLS